VRFSTNQYPWFRWLFDRYVFPPEARVLEIGCGPALLWRENRDRIPPDAHLTLTDLSPGMLEEARSNLDGIEQNVTYQVADAQALPFADGEYDMVIANHMLYHVPDRPRAIREVRRVLRAGGVFYAATNGDTHLRELYALLCEVAPGSVPNRRTSGFSLENGEEQLCEAFSEVHRERYDDSFTVTAVEPLVRYVLSGWLIAKLTEDQVDRLRAAVSERIERDGVLHIGKDVGLFIAR
jgi:SAM-dependent methyltransferase